MYSLCELCSCRSFIVHDLLRIRIDHLIIYDPCEDMEIFMFDEIGWDGYLIDKFGHFREQAIKSHLFHQSPMSSCFI